MAEDTIRRIFFTPSVAIARLGASSSPMDAFDWGPGDPHTIGETRIRPAWSLEVDTNGNVTAWLPKEIRVRDGALHRPVAPFLELWALTGDEPDLQPNPVTPALLAANGVAPARLTFTVTAMNLKAARRCRDPRLRFGTFPPVAMPSDHHRVVPLRGQSPQGVTNPMIPPPNFIPLGHVQVLRPQGQPPGDVVPEDVRLDVMRLRYTPAAGLFYGPPQAASTDLPEGPAVVEEHAFLNSDAGWFTAAYEQNGALRTAIVSPPDTYDMVGSTGISLGVVDDTCELLITASMSAAGQALQARANIAVGPPHFAPDRRPFLSLADEINDRDDDPANDDPFGTEELDRWVEDLFERTYETANLLDLDYWRLARAAEVPEDQRRPAVTPSDDGVPQPDRAMGGRDSLRDPAIRVLEPTPGRPFPLSERARERHRALSDISALRSFVLQNPERLTTLIRQPFSFSTEESPVATSMRMPPFMRNSNAFPLTLSNRQYRLLTEWQQAVRSAGVAAVAEAEEGLPALSSQAARRRRQVLNLLAAEQQ